MRRLRGFNRGLALWLRRERGPERSAVRRRPAALRAGRRLLRRVPLVVSRPATRDLLGLASTERDLNVDDKTMSTADGGSDVSMHDRAR